jgi:hypothetical protein
MMQRSSMDNPRCGYWTSRAREWRLSSTRSCTLKAVGLPILLAEQNVSLALEVADRASVIEKGQRAVRWRGDGAA